MIDKIKSSLNTSYMLFCFEMGDSSSIDKETLVKSIGCPLDEIFDSQKQCDLAKSKLGKSEFQKILSLYFASFQTGDGLDVSGLDAELKANKAVMLRHLGKDKMAYLQLIIATFKSANEIERRKGLLFLTEAG